MRGDDQQLQNRDVQLCGVGRSDSSRSSVAGVRKLVDAVLGEMSKDFDGV